VRQRLIKYQEQVGQAHNKIQGRITPSAHVNNNNNNNNNNNTTADEEKAKKQKKKQIVYESISVTIKEGCLGGSFSLTSYIVIFLAKRSNCQLQ